MNTEQKQDNSQKITTEEITAERLTWPSPFNALIEKLISLKGKKVGVEYEAYGMTGRNAL